jgi:nicotinamide-nucleotide amidase
MSGVVDGPAELAGPFGSEGATEQQIAAKAAELVREFTERGLTLATAESLTGGLVSGAVTGIAGSSAVLRGGVTAYATDVKASLLGVDADLLAREGPVHPEVARQMSLGVRRLLGTGVGVATTGVAGPTPQDGVPAGLVYIAAAGPDGRTRVEECRFEGGRAEVRQETVLRALRLALSC